jgi:hypothetical protein
MQLMYRKLEKPLNATRYQLLGHLPALTDDCDVPSTLFNLL